MAKKQKPEKPELEKMIDEIRSVIARYGHIPEAAVYDALDEEAEGWRLRLRELQEEDES